MTEKELKRLSRADLLDLLIDQSKELQKTKKRLHAARTELENREIAIQNADHAHEDACYTEALVCSLPEHAHEENCHAEPVLACAEAENHVHSAACYEMMLGCGLEETEGHTHTDECYAQLSELICAAEETAAYDELVCAEPQAQEHVHSDACLTVEMQRVLVCGVEEHSHSLICYSDTIDQKPFRLRCGRASFLWLYPAKLAESKRNICISGIEPGYQSDTGRGFVISERRK